MSARMDAEFGCVTVRVRDGEPTVLVHTEAKTTVTAHATKHTRWIDISSDDGELTLFVNDDAIIEALRKALDTFDK